jgi:hypothetical protein
MPVSRVVNEVKPALPPGGTTSGATLPALIGRQSKPAGVARRGAPQATNNIMQVIHPCFADRKLFREDADLSHSFSPTTVDGRAAMQEWLQATILHRCGTAKAN